MRLVPRVVALALALAAVVACSASGVTQKVVTDPGTPIESSDCTGEVPPNTFRYGSFNVNPLQLHVLPGTTVRWVHCGPETNLHSVVSDSGVFTSPRFGPGYSYARQFDVVGTFPFHCYPHLMMQGTLIVDPT